MNTDRATSGKCSVSERMICQRCEPKKKAHSASCPAICLTLTVLLGHQSWHCGHDHGRNDMHDGCCHTAGLRRRRDMAGIVNSPEMTG